MKTFVSEAEAYEYIIELIYARCRIRLHEGKRHLIRARLGKRLRHYGFSSLTEYCDLLETTADEEEITHAVDALTTNFTSFLREEEHFRFLVQDALPVLLTGKRRPVHVWSAACATGEEAFSIAFYLAEHYPIGDGWDWRVYGADISSKALAVARKGIYPGERLEVLPDAWLPRYFQRGVRRWEGYYRVKPALAERVVFEQLNLLGTYQFAEPFDVIFCRNVMIYFDRATQEELVERLTRWLKPKGFLLTGHSESLTGIQAPFRCLRPSIYQKL